MNMNVYTKNINGNIVIINNDRYSLRCRQRGINIDGSKVKPLKFVSYREVCDKYINNKLIYGPLIYYTISKL